MLIATERQNPVYHVEESHDRLSAKWSGEFSAADTLLGEMSAADGDARVESLTKGADSVKDAAHDATKDPKEGSKPKPPKKKSSTPKPKGAEDPMKGIEEKGSDMMKKGEKELGDLEKKGMTEMKDMMDKSDIPLSGLMGENSKHKKNDHKQPDDSDKSKTDDHGETKPNKDDSLLKAGEEVVKDITKDAAKMEKDVMDDMMDVGKDFMEGCMGL
ncbi:hypothetical protein EVAR_88727_1 [Eumeta japonica]|uniref:Uncharacterized protein n=1 Tax=Eumeta variegata TaxID=151549 RepID=A0A4C1XF48_EUMVA|nr:hypothetical protein EVAR_88727_1 [Eumeta japonica]